MKWLKEQVSDVNVKAKSGWTPMYWAANECRFEIMKWLKGQGVDVNIKDRDGWTPMHHAVYYGNFEAMEWLKAEGLDINAGTNDGRTPLDLANELKENKPYMPKVIEWLEANSGVQIDVF